MCPSRLLRVNQAKQIVGFSQPTVHRDRSLRVGEGLVVLILEKQCGRAADEVPGVRLGKSRQPLIGVDSLCGGVLLLKTLPGQEADFRRCRR